jgi:type I site-specific restriction endonuclease
MNKEELINLYNSISGNPAYTVEQRVKTMHDIKERIDELDAQKAADTKQKRLDALAKARAKRAENLKNGIKPEKKEKKPRQKKAKMSMDSTVSDLKYNLRRGVESDGYISNSDFRVEDYGNSVSVQVRYLGKWKNPSHARYEEDYDWQELKSSSGKQIDKVIKKLSKQSGRKITWGASEKNWIDIDIPKMKGD